MEYTLCLDQLYGCIVILLSSLCTPVWHFVINSGPHFAWPSYTAVQMKCTLVSEQWENHKYNQTDPHRPITALTLGLPHPLYYCMLATALLSHVTGRGRNKDISGQPLMLDCVIQWAVSSASLIR